MELAKRISLPPGLTLDRYCRLQVFIPYLCSTNTWVSPCKFWGATFFKNPVRTRMWICEYCLARIVWLNCVLGYLLKLDSELLTSHSHACCVWFGSVLEI